MQMTYCDRCRAVTDWPTKWRIYDLCKDCNAELLLWINEHRRKTSPMNAKPKDNPIAPPAK